MSHTITAILYDLATNELADISGIALEKSLKRGLHQARVFTLTAPAGHSLLTATSGYDGLRVLRKGNRKLIVWEDDDPQPLFHGRVRRVERTGDGRENLVTITAGDARLELGYDGDDSAGRPVRDATGNLIDPKFTPSVSNSPATAISGPDLIRQVLQNSQGNVTTIGDPNLHEGQLPIDLDTGVFDLDVPPAIDLSVIDTMDWPVLCGDFINQLVESGVVDVDLRPVSPTEGFDPYVMVALSAVSSLGVDRSDTVHFDYWTGSYNAQACQHIEDFSTICNKLYDFLGPRMIDQEHWKGSINPGAPGTTVDPSASRARYGGPGPDYGEFMQIRILDSLETENRNRPLYLALWNAEALYRAEPRDLLFITPCLDTKALFEPPQAFDVGDQVAINVGEALGVELAETQRVFGYEKTWNRENVARVSQLLTSADPE